MFRNSCFNSVVYKLVSVASVEPVLSTSSLVQKDFNTTLN